MIIYENYVDVKKIKITMSSNKVPRKNYQKDLLEAYFERISECEHFCSLFDSGQTNYATALAGNIYNLCEDNGSDNNSILKQLEIKDRIRFYTTVPDKKGMYISGSPLVLPEFKVIENGDLDLKLKPILNNNLNIDNIAHKKITFKEWWKEWICFDYSLKPDSNKTMDYNIEPVIRRGDLINYVRKQDSSGHFDSEINGKLAKIKTNYTRLDVKNNSIIFNFVKDQNHLTSEKVEEVYGQFPRVLIRQIAFELLNSLNEVNVKSFLNWK
jgi:hypothetical protein